MLPDLWFSVISNEGRELAMHILPRSNTSLRQPKKANMPNLRLQSWSPQTNKLHHCFYYYCCYFIYLIHKNEDGKKLLAIFWSCRLEIIQVCTNMELLHWDPQCTSDFTQAWKTMTYFHCTKNYKVIISQTALHATKLVAHCVCVCVVVFFLEK